MARRGRSRHPVSRRRAPTGGGKCGSHRSPAGAAERRRAMRYGGSCTTRRPMLRGLSSRRAASRTSSLAHLLRVTRRWLIAFVPAVIRTYTEHVPRAARPARSQPRRLDLSAASRESHSPPTSAIQETASESGSGVTRYRTSRPVALAIDQAGLRQRVEVLDDCLARDRQLAGELGRGRRVSRDSRKQPPSCRVGKRAEHGSRPVVLRRHAATSAGPYVAPPRPGSGNAH